MTKLSFHGPAPFLLALGLVCLPPVARPQVSPGPPALPPIVLDGKTAGRMVETQAAPEYPPLAKVNYIQGRVRLAVQVAGDGKVLQAHVLRGNPILAASALKAIRSWVYHPLITASGHSPFLTTVEMNFTLRPRKLEPLPAQAESDLGRQIKPPVVIGRPADPPPINLVHMRLLLDDQGQVIDFEATHATAGDLETARKALEGWGFRPAHWGSLPIPWYLEVDVPISEPSADQAAADLSLR